MSKEKVLTGEVDASGWFIDPMTTMFRMQSNKLWMTVQPGMSNIGICKVKDSDNIPEDFQELKEEDARLILLSIKNALDRALAGEEFELNIEPWPQ